VTITSSSATDAGLIWRERFALPAPRTRQGFEAITSSATAEFRIVRIRL
jgi:hypothetical protein